MARLTSHAAVSPTCRDLGDGLGARLRHLRLVVRSELDEGVRVMEHERLAVPARVDDTVLVGEVGDVEVDDPGRRAEVAGVGREVEEGLAAVGPRRLGELPDLVDREVAQGRAQQPLVRRGGLSGRRQHLDVEVGVVVVPAGHRGTADEDDPEVGIGLTLLA